jgi:hypothetical protein
MGSRRSRQRSGLARRVRVRDLLDHGGVTAAELADSAIARIDAANPTLNAVVVPLPDIGVCPRCRSRAAARRFTACSFAEVGWRLPGRPTAIHGQRAAAVAGLAGALRHHPRCPLPRRRPCHHRQDGAARVRPPTDHPGRLPSAPAESVGHHAIQRGIKRRCGRRRRGRSGAGGARQRIGGSIQLPVVWCGVPALKPNARSAERCWRSTSSARPRRSSAAPRCAIICWPALLTALAGCRLMSDPQCRRSS